MKNKKTLIYASRFMIIFLSIISQAIAIWVLFFILGQRYAWVEVALNVLGVILFAYVVNKNQGAVYKLPWVVLILIAPLGGLVIYYTFGNLKLSKKQMKSFRHVYDESHDEYYRQDEVLKRMDGEKIDSRGIFKYVRSVTSLPVFDNSKATYIPTGEDFLESLVSEISKAERYVFLEYFIIEEGEMWDRIFTVLKFKMAKGVKVYLMYDDVGSISKVPRGFNKTLCEEGIDARRFFKFVPIVSVIHNNRDHRKIAVIDGKVGFISGANIADEYINVKKPFGRWLDNAVKLEGQAVDSLIRLFVQLYNMAGSPALLEKDFIIKEHQTFSDGYIMPFGDSPSPIDDDHIAENVYLDIITRSDDYLYIATPYLIVDTNILDALKNAVRRGVDVRVIIPEIPDKKPVFMMTKNACASLMEAGVKIYQYRGGFIHSKTFLSDGEIAVVGTANLDFRSLVHHFECATLLCQTSSIKDLYADFNRLFDNECIRCGKKELSLKWYEKPIRAVLSILAPLM